MSIDKPKIFIILLNWNNWHETKECLESLEKVDYPNFGVIIVDNGSSKPPPLPLSPRFAGGAGLRKEGASPKVGMIANSDNLGFAGGNNIGIKYALEHGADYAMLLNNDTVVGPDFLTELVKAAENDASLGVLGSRIYKYGTDEVVFDGGKINKWLTNAEHIVMSVLDTESPPPPYPPLRKGGVGGVREADYVTGAAMLVKREVIKKIGVMREEYFLYYEDVDWCVRARRAGYKCVLVPTSKIWHKVSATTKEGSPSYIYYHTRNALILAKLNGNIPQKIAAYVMGLWILLKQAIKFFLLPSKRVWIKSMTRGVLDFYLGKYGKYENRH